MFDESSGYGLMEVEVTRGNRFWIVAEADYYNSTVSTVCEHRGGRRFRCEPVNGRDAEVRFSPDFDELRFTVGRCSLLGDPY